MAYSINPQTDGKFPAILSLLLARVYTHLSRIHKLRQNCVSLMVFLTTDFPNQNEKRKDFCASPGAKNRRVNARRSAAGVVLRNVVSCLQTFHLR